MNEPIITKRIILTHSIVAVWFFIIGMLIGNLTASPDCPKKVAHHRTKKHVVYKEQNYKAEPVSVRGYDDENADSEQAEVQVTVGKHDKK